MFLHVIMVGMAEMVRHMAADLATVETAMCLQGPAEQILVLRLSRNLALHCCLESAVRSQGFVTFDVEMRLSLRLSDRSYAGRVSDVTVRTDA